MSRRFALTALAVSLTLALGVTACGADDSADTAAAHETTAAVHEHDSLDTSPALRLREDMRKLWEDHITWTRLFIVSAVAGLPDTDAAANRLLQNQADIGDAIAEYYGAAAGAQLTGLLRSHILVAADLVAAAKTGDNAKVEKEQADWDANAVEIADFLAAANPAWPARALTDMMREHLAGTLAEATSRLSGDWQSDIAAYDRVHTHILTMADALTAGIVEQFPDRFK